MTTNKFWADDNGRRQGTSRPNSKQPKPRHRHEPDRSPEHARRVRASISTSSITFATRDPNADMIAAMHERGRSYVRLLIKAGLDGDRALLSMAHTIIKSLDEPPVTFERGEVKTLDGVQTLTVQLDTMGVNRRDPIHRRLVAEAFVRGGMRELQQLGI